MPNKTFMDRYNEDPEFRKKHLDKLNRKVVCECGNVCSAANMHRHRKTKMHKKRIETANKIIDATNEIKKTTNELKNLYEQIQIWEKTLHK